MYDIIRVLQKTSKTDRQITGLPTPCENCEICTAELNTCQANNCQFIVFRQKRHRFSVANAFVFF